MYRGSIAVTAHWPTHRVMESKGPEISLQVLVCSSEKAMLKDWSYSSVVEYVSSTCQARVPSPTPQKHNAQNLTLV